LPDGHRLERGRARARRLPRQSRRQLLGAAADQAGGRPDGVRLAGAALPRRRLDGARVLRHVRRAVRRPSGSPPHPARRRLGGTSAPQVLCGRHAASALPVADGMSEVRAIDYHGSERLTMNMGPQHPSAHRVFRAILTLEGETVVGVDAVIGYLHRCHEKLAETLAYVQYPTIASKTDYVAAMCSELAYVSAAE